jgi:hypothetical protein
MRLVDKRILYGVRDVSGTVYAIGFPCRSEASKVRRFYALGAYGIERKYRVYRYTWKRYA